MAKKIVKAKSISEADIITMYMTYVLEHDTVPKSIYKFCKVNHIEEKDFYAHFGSVEARTKRYLVKILYQH